jgi:hypothetical protein
MASFDQAGLEIYSDWFLIRGTKAPLEPNKLSGVLLQLAPGATAQQLRFGILANLPSVKVVSGESMLTSISHLGRWGNKSEPTSHLRVVPGFRRLTSKTP